MRICIDCKVSLEEYFFDYRGGGRKGLQATCKPCSLNRLRKHRRFIRGLVNRWKERKGCLWCGFKGRHYQLHLDHIEPGSKKNKGNSRAYEPSWSLKRVKQEIRKCQILCANCHAHKTFSNSDHLFKG